MEGGRNGEQKEGGRKEKSKEGKREGGEDGVWLSLTVPSSLTLIDDVCNSL